MAATLLQALQAWWVNRGLGGPIAGGLAGVEAAEAAAVPYVVVREDSVREDLRTRGSTRAVCSSVVLRFRVYATGLAEAERLGGILAAELEGLRVLVDGLAVADGELEGEGRSGRERQRTEGGERLWWHERTVRVRVIRSY